MSQETIDLGKDAPLPERAAESQTPAQDGAQLTKWARGVDRYRETAKWAIGAFAAIGVLLAGTAPLAGISGTASDRGWAVIGGAILGLAGVGMAIAATVSMLVPRVVYWHEIREQEQSWFNKLFRGLGSLEDVLARHPTTLLPPGIRTLRELTSAIRHLSDHVALTSSRSIDPNRPEAERAKWGIAHERYEAQLNQLIEAENELMLAGRFEKARVAFRVGFAGMVIGALLAGGGLGLLLFGSHDVTEVAKAEAEVAKLNAETRKIEAETANLQIPAP